MTETQSLSARRLKAWIRLLRLTRKSENRIREFLRVEFETTLPRFDVMAALYRNGAPMKMSEISRMLLVSNGNSTSVVDRLEKDGVVARKRVAGDRRSFAVSLTDKGRAQFEQQAKAHEALVNEMFGQLGHKELDEIRDLLSIADGAEHDDDA